MHLCRDAWRPLEGSRVCCGNPPGCALGVKNAGLHPESSLESISSPDGGDFLFAFVLYLILA